MWKYCEICCVSRKIYIKEKKIQIEDREKKKTVTTVATVPPVTVVTVQNLEKEKKRKKKKKEEDKVPHQNCIVDE